MLYKIDRSLPEHIAGHSSDIICPNPIEKSIEKEMIPQTTCETSPRISSMNYTNNADMFSMNTLLPLATINNNEALLPVATRNSLLPLAANETMVTPIASESSVLPTSVSMLNEEYLQHSANGVLLNNECNGLVATETPRLYNGRLMAPVLLPSLECIPSYTSDDDNRDIGSVSPASLSSPEIVSQQSSDAWYSDYSPGGVANHTEDTQASLVQKSSGLCLDDDTIQSALSTLDKDIESFSNVDLWYGYQDDQNKVLKMTASDIPSTTTTTIDHSGIFDADSAVSSTQFVFAKFGSSTGPETLSSVTPTTTASTENNSTKSSNRSASKCQSPTVKRESSGSLMTPPPSRRHKELLLNQTFPSKTSKYQLEILVQPELQHRARYKTEGSRGSVKDESQDGYPVVKLLGYEGPAILQVFVGCDTGKVRPHGFYQACKVSGKNSSPCSERDIDGTVVIVIPFGMESDMKCSVDCVGILKLRNADVEQRIGLAKSRKKSTKTRMVFRVSIPRQDGGRETLQIASTTIMCKQLAGQPEICRRSLSECLVTGGQDLFIVGKNFTKGCKVVFTECTDSNEVTWEENGVIDQEFFQPTHIIVTVPPYRLATISKPVNVLLSVRCGQRDSEPHTFTYTPVSPSGGQLKPEPMVADSAESRSKQMKWVSPEAVKLSNMCQQESGVSGGIFKIPAAVPMDAAVSNQNGLGGLLSIPNDSKNTDPIIQLSYQDVTDMFDSCG